MNQEMFDGQPKLNSVKIVDPGTGILNSELLTASIIRAIMNRHREGLPKKWSVKFATALTVAALWRKYAQGS